MHRFRHYIWSLIKSACGRIPVIDGLPRVDRKHIASAAKEILVTLLVSLSPLFFGAWVLTLTQSTKFFPGYLASLISMLQNGELIFYSSTLLAPLIYLLLSDKLNGKVFPSKLSHAVIVVGILLVSLTTFVIFKLDPSAIKIDILNVSYYIFGATVFLLFVGQAYENNIFFNPSETYKQVENNYSSNYRQHRRETE